MPDDAAHCRLGRHDPRAPLCPAVSRLAVVDLRINPPPTTPTGALAPWVSVDESGQPKTITPILTTISGTPTTLPPAPFAVTASVLTQTRPDAKLTTSTGPSAPEATSPNGSSGGAFPICTNTPPSFLAPFCSPENNSTLHPGVTHYGPPPSHTISTNPGPANSNIEPHLLPPQHHPPRRRLLHPPLFLLLPRRSLLLPPPPLRMGFLPMAHHPHPLHHASPPAPRRRQHHPAHRGPPPRPGG